MWRFMQFDTIVENCYRIPTPFAYFLGVYIMDPFQFIQEQEVVALTQRLVKIESDWNTPCYEKNALDSLSTFLEDEGIPFTKESIDENRYNILVHFKGDRPGRTLL